ncbi:demethoxyubiquinone hydroxylase family protein [Anaerospora hongkongensis]|uniref:demethoxyubiquinone hydroxylase family protein n=1 Tax=Anaerospora hongkongensis TaxID=244830 RepID=UPI0028965410|nr:demethoxyubiquinone hydroxylase family protein [Anaerospora hongkongensis]
MSYGKPESGAMQASPLGQLLIMLREDLMGELQAINQYQAHIDNIEEAEIKELLEHIRDDEKEHVAELTHLISRVDAIQREKFLNDHTAAPADRVSTGKDESQVLTVGNLFGKK